MSHFTDSLANRKRLQQALADAKKLGGSPYYMGTIDGILGGQTALAISLYRNDHDLGTGAVIDNTLLRELGLGTALITEPGTLGNVFFNLALQFGLSQLKGNPVFAFLDGYKTYIVAFIAILDGLAAMLGWQVPGLPQLGAADGWNLVLAGFAGLGIRRAITTNGVAAPPK